MPNVITSLPKVKLNNKLQLDFLFFPENVTSPRDEMAYGICTSPISPGKLKRLVKYFMSRKPASTRM